jgi:hypothetical protein
MAWKLLPVNYTDAVWAGLKKYEPVNNDDGTVSFRDVTAYSNRENSFFGAKDANEINEAINAIMSMVESGTDLYTAFQNYFAVQKGLFENSANQTQREFTSYVGDLKTEGDAVVSSLKTDYRNEISAFEDNQEEQFNTWFNFIGGQMSGDVAGNMQNQIDSLETKTDGFEARATAFSEDGKTITESYGNKRIETEFVSDNVIVQKLYEGNVLIATKNVTFAPNGLSISEEVK